MNICSYVAAGRCIALCEYVLGWSKIVLSSQQICWVACKIRSDAWKILLVWSVVWSVNLTFGEWSFAGGWVAPTRAWAAHRWTSSILAPCFGYKSEHWVHLWLKQAIGEHLPASQICVWFLAACFGDKSRHWVHYWLKRPLGEHLPSNESFQLCVFSLAISIFLFFNILLECFFFFRRTRLTSSHVYPKDC